MTRSGGSDDISYEQRQQLYGGFSENDLIEQPAIELFASLGWQTADLYGEFSGRGGSVEGRASKRDAILPNRLRLALKRLNPDLPQEALDDAYSVIARERGAIDPIRANAEIHDLLLNGVKVEIRGAGGARVTETVRVIDWVASDQNDFLLASQVWFAGELYTKRADLVGFVNGLPLLFIELKAAHRAMADAYTGNLSDYRTTIPHVFTPNAFVVLSNGREAVLGAPQAPLEYFAEWKRVDDEDEPGVVSLDTLIKGACRPARFLDLIENFIVFEEGKNGLVKKLGKTHQLLGVNRAIAAVDKIDENRGRLGVFWHTQGSGKSLSMLFFARKVLRKKPGDWTFLIVTDRTELDEQITGTFSACGALIKTRDEVQARSREHLKELLRGNERYIFTLIQKFGTARGEVYPVLSTRKDIIVITDEAHRSQYDTLAANMRAALPNAAFIGFTGTPLIAGEEERTREVFGDYVSIYDFAQSIADGATVPLYYESRLPELHLTNEQLGDEIAQVIDDADLTEEEEDALSRRFAKQYHLITNNDRLEKVAADLVRHFSARGYRGKAMFVAIDKATAIRMYDKVRHHWDEMLAREAKRVAAISDAVERAALQEQVDWLAKTDMAVVVSPSQNEIQLMAKRGLDIEPHRRRLVKENLDEKFKAAEDPLRLVFVCAMWITGFDVPTCSTVYIDKPMKNHTLMQTIARANRVSAGKQAGLIVDYVGVFRNLKAALAIYAQPRPGVTTDPIERKEKLVEELRVALRLAVAFAEARDVRPAEVMRVNGFERQAALQQAAERLLGNDEEKRTYLRLVSDAWKLFRAVLPDPATIEFRGDMIVLQVVAEMIRTMTRKGPTRSALAAIAEIERLIDEAIAGVEIRAPVPSGEDMKQLFDLSTVDFDRLTELFAQGRKRTATEILRGQAEERVKGLANRNPTRVDLLERLNSLIDRYNAGSLDAERLFEELTAFARSLNEEEQRHLKVGLTEDELAIFDILTRPEPKLTKADEVNVKAIARELLDKLKQEKLILDWRLRESAKADVRETIRQELDQLPEVYDRKLWDEKVERTYQFVFEHFPYSAEGRTPHN
ncbi:type I restriction endonuclease subunit R [Methylosinus sp. H3A]|uniref:type I restriction endonuclease subunit R n=1 Tax=Methylosinus sp. H3A TaxID=2785786 RepID=UPI0018C2D0FC|nr:type I restriction endonuclease subunit R [Methylosinus sp. H3A]MBG0810806.1 type I restriction endonuclease subunit R [Methylosinus sp. H3A]